MQDETRVRPATFADAEAIRAIYAPIVRDTAISFEEAAPDAAEIGRRMLGRPRFPWLVCERSGRVVGYAYASTHRARAAYRWCAECSVYVAAELRSRGVGRALYGQLFAELAELGYVSVLAGITLPNEASVGIHEALGFEAVGVFRCAGYKLGAWHDVGWWGRVLRDAPATPEEPVEWSPVTP